MVAYIFDFRNQCPSVLHLLTKQSESHASKAYDTRTSEVQAVEQLSGVLSSSPEQIYVQGYDSIYCVSAERHHTPWVIHTLPRFRVGDPYSRVRLESLA